MLLLTLFRYVAICHPLRTLQGSNTIQYKKGLKQTIASIAGIWMGALFLSVLWIPFASVRTKLYNCFEFNTTYNRIQMFMESDKSVFLQIKYVFYDPVTMKKMYGNMNDNITLNPTGLLRVAESSTCVVCRSDTYNFKSIQPTLIYSWARK